MKKFLVGLVACMVALCVFGCGSGEKSATSATKVLKVGTNAEFPPFEFVDSKNVITGFDIELINELAKRSGVKVEFVNMNFDAIIPAIKFGKIDAAISGISATPERREAIDFSDSYYTTENVFIRKKGNNAIKDRESLVGKKVAVLLGSVQEMAGKNVTGAVLLAADSVTANVLAVKSGRAEAAILDSSIAYGFIKQNDDIEAFLSEPDGSDGFAIAFDKGKQTELIAKFNAALKAMKEDGSYAKLIKRYDLK